MYRATDIRCVRNISSIVTDTASSTERGDAVLDELLHLIPYAAAQISAWDEQRQTHYIIATRGYPPRVQMALNGTHYRDDLVWQFLERSDGAVFWRDCPFDRSESAFYSQALAPHGYREGGTVLLRDPKRGYLGMLAINLETYQAPAEDARMLLGIIGAGLAPLMDRFDVARRLAAACAPQRAAAVYHPHWGWMDLTGDGLPPVSFLEMVRIPAPTELPIRSNWRDPAAQWSHARKGLMTSIAYELYPIHEKNCEVLLTWSREATPYKLTTRETDVLAAVARGLSNAEIGRQLGVSVRTVSTHVERILNKLDVSTRAAAASIAVRLGLYR